MQLLVDGVPQLLADSCDYLLIAVPRPIKIKTFYDIRIEKVILYLLQIATEKSLMRNGLHPMSSQGYGY